MTRKVLLRPQTKADLTAIWDNTIKAWSVAQAEVYLLSLDQMFQKLAEFPEMARLLPEFIPTVRIHTFRKHVIIYSIEETAIDVIRIVHSRTNWAEFLAE